MNDRTTISARINARLLQRSPDGVRIESAHRLRNGPARRVDLMPLARSVRERGILSACRLSALGSVEVRKLGLAQLAAAARVGAVIRFTPTQLVSFKISLVPNGGYESEMEPCPITVVSRFPIVTPSRCSHGSIAIRVSRDSIVLEENNEPEITVTTREETMMDQAQHPVDETSKGPRSSVVTENVFDRALEQMIAEISTEELVKREKPPSPTPTGHSPMLARLLDEVRAPVNVVLGEMEITLGELLEISAGSRIEVDLDEGLPVRLCLGGHGIASGELQHAESGFAIEIKKVETISAIELADESMNA